MTDAAEARAVRNLLTLLTMLSLAWVGWVISRYVAQWDSWADWCARDGLRVLWISGPVMILLIIGIRKEVFHTPKAK